MHSIVLNNVVIDTILPYIPKIPNCMGCNREIDGISYGRVEELRQNGGFEWWVYCPICDVETFSQTYAEDAV